MRLSWPKDDDTRRAISTPLVMRQSVGTNLPFINTTLRDVELYRHLSLQLQPRHLVQPSPDLWKQPQLIADHTDLLHYCKSGTMSWQACCCSISS